MKEEFKQFPVYIKALDLAEEVNLLCQNVKTKDFYYLKDQLRRASSSIVLNIAEGAGRWTKRDKSNFYKISRGSTFECIAALDLFESYFLINKENGEPLRNKLKEIGKDLQSLIISVDKRIK